MKNNEFGEAGMLWDFWSDEQREKWTEYNVTNPEKGEVARHQIDHKNNIIMSTWDGPTEDQEFPDLFEYPDHLKTDPQYMLIVNYKYRRVQPLEYVDLDKKLDAE